MTQPIPCIREQISRTDAARIVANAKNDNEVQTQEDDDGGINHSESEGISFFQCRVSHRKARV